MIRSLLMLMVAPSAVGVQAGMTEPNLSGRWQLSVDRSAYEQSPGPRVQTDTIRQTTDRVDIGVTSTVRDITVRYRIAVATDGELVTVSPAPRVDPSRRLTAVSARWQGSTLAVRQDLEADEGPFTVIDYYDLAPGGSSLSIRSERGDGRVLRTLVFDRCGTGDVTCR